VPPHVFVTQASYGVKGSGYASHDGQHFFIMINVGLKKIHIVVFLNGSNLNSSFISPWK